MTLALGYGGHNHSGSGAVIILIYHVTLQDQVIKGSFDFMEMIP